MSLESAVKNDKASDRLKAANALSLAAQGYTLYDTANKVFSKDPTQAYLFRAESGIGVAHSRQSQELNGSQSQGNLINAKHIHLNATAGNLTAIHTTFSSNDKEGKRQAGSTITLNARDDILLNAGESHQEQKGRSQNAGVEVGTAISIGAQTGWSFYGKVGFGNQKQDGSQTTYHNTQLDSENLQITSGKDTALLGATAKAKEITVNTGGNLTIESLQDSQTQSQKGMNASIQVEFGFGNSWNISGNASGERGKSNFKQVNKQSSLFAEEGGYHVEANNVHLKGGVIASTNAENSELTTNNLTFEDIKNESSHSASSASISGGYGKGADYNVDKETGKVVSEKYAKANKGTTEEVKPKATPNFGGGLPMYSQDSDSTLTKAMLTEGKITLNKDSNPIQTTAKALGINTDLTQANQQVDKPKDVASELNEQKQLAKSAGDVIIAVDTFTNNLYQETKSEEEKAKQVFEDAKKSGDQTKIEEARKTYRQAVETQENWEIGGKYKQVSDAITATVTMALAGKPVEAVATGGLSPYINQAIKEITQDIPELNIPIHMLWGAVEAHLMGGNSVSGALAVGVGELSAAYLTKEVYQKDPRELSESEKQHIIEINKIVAGVARGLVSSVQGENLTATLTHLKIDTQISENALENNFAKVVVTGAKVIYKVAKKRVKNGRLHIDDLKQTLKDEGLDILDNISTLLDGELSWDDAFALIDLIVGTELNTSNKGVSAKKLEELSDEINKRLIRKVDGYDVRTINSIRLWFI